MLNVGTDSAYKDELRGLYSYPPYGLLSMASVLKSHGYDVKLIDLFSESLTRESLVQQVQECKHEVLAVGIATYTEILHLAMEAVDIIKNVLPDTTMILGGAHATFSPQEVLANDNVDFVIRREGESTFIPLLEHIKYQSLLNLQDIEGISYREGTVIKSTPERPFIQNIDHLPFPAFQLLRKEAIYSDTVSIISSRGCPGRCTFCASRAFSGQKYRMHSAEWLFSLLYFYNETIREFRTINFMDDTFTANKKRLKRFAGYIKNVGWNKIWSCKSRADSLSEEVIRLLAQSGCRSIHIGVESGDQDILDSIDKNINLEECLESIRLLKKYNIRVECSFIIGLPQDTLESIDKTVILASEINKAKIGMAFIGFATPFPGTEMYVQSTSNGNKVHTKNWRNYSTFKPIFDTDKFTVQDLRRAHYFFNNVHEMPANNQVVSSADLSDYREQVLNWVKSVG